jgi:hypothetical protein
MNFFQIIMGWHFLLAGLILKKSFSYNESRYFIDDSFTSRNP